MSLALSVYSKFWLRFYLNILFDSPVCFWIGLLVNKSLHAYLSKFCFGFFPSGINLFYFDNFLRECSYPKCYFTGLFKFPIHSIKWISLIIIKNDLLLQQLNLTAVSPFYSLKIKLYLFFHGFYFEKSSIFKKL